MAWVYILRGGRDRRFYVGSTTDMGARLVHHFGGHTPTTKRFGNIALVFSQEFPTLAKAREIERRLKRLKRKDYLEKIVKEGRIKMGQ